MDHARPPEKKKLGPQLALLCLVVMGLVAALAFTFYWSRVGPSPCFAILHDEDVRLQEVMVNGQDASLAGGSNEHHVFRDVRPGDAVMLEVVTSDGRSYQEHFQVMGRETRVIQLDDRNLKPTARGVLEIEFTQRKPIVHFRYRVGRTRVVHASPYEVALRTGGIPVEVEWEHNGLRTWTKKKVHLRSGERITLSLEEFLSRPEIGEPPHPLDR